MKVQVFLLIVVLLAFQSSCKRKRHGHKRKSYTEDGKKRGQIESRSRLKLHKKLTKGKVSNADPDKRSRYSEAFLDQYEPRNKEYPDYNKDIIDNYATENTPVFWKEVSENNALKKDDGELPPVGFQQGEDELPSTVGPNENVYGGFPINDVLGGFELPSPETLAVLKLALKQHGPRNEYEAKLHHDLENWAYGYEHHALPEYDIKETPPFYVAMLEGLKMLQENKQKPSPSCKQGKAGCGPMVQLTDDQCNTLAGNCPPSKPVTSEAYEKPCPWKIIEMLYGCKQPSTPQAEEKPDEAPPPLPKPDKPEKPVEVKPEKPEEKKPLKAAEGAPASPVTPAPEKKPENAEPQKKPKPIPIEFPSTNKDKLAPDIKDDDDTAAAGTEAQKQNSKLQEDLNILGMISSQPMVKQQPQSRTDFSAADSNSSTAENKTTAQFPEITLEVDNSKSNAMMESELTTKGKPEKARPPTDTGNATRRHKNVLDLSFLPAPEGIQLGKLKGRQLELLYPNREKLFVKLPSMRELSQGTGLQRSIWARKHLRRKYSRYKIVETEPASSLKAIKNNVNVTKPENKTIKEVPRNESTKTPSQNGTLSGQSTVSSSANQRSKQQAVLSTKGVTLEDLSPVITSLGKELEAQLTKKIGKSKNTTTVFTINVGIAPETFRSRKDNITSSIAVNSNQTLSKKVN